MYSAYVIQSQKNGRFYYGCTKDRKRRLSEHNLGKNRATKYMVPWRLVYYEEFKTLSEARQREKYFKSGKGREYIKRQVRAVAWGDRS